MLDKNNVENVMALTFTQEGILSNYLLNPDSKQYNNHFFLDLNGKINLKIFKEAWNHVIETNEMLRVVFRWEGLEKPVQIVLKDYNLKVNYYEIPSIDTYQCNILLEERIKKDSEKKLELVEVPFKVSLYKCSENNYKMCISNHHIIYDGWSMGIILEEFLQAYRRLANGKNPVTYDKTKFVEYIKYIQMKDRSYNKLFWQDYLAGVDEQAEISIKRKTKEPINNVCKYKIKLPHCKIDSFTKSYDITLASFLYCVWGFILHRYNNSDDVIFGTTLAGRNYPIKDIDQMIGLFINTLPLRVKFDSVQNFLELVRQVNDIMYQLNTYEITSLPDIKEYGKLKNTSDLFDTIVIIENYPLKNCLKKVCGEFNIGTYTMYEMTNYDLAVFITILEDNIEVNFHYNVDKFKSKSIELLANHFKNVANEFISNPKKNISNISMITDEETNLIIHDFNSTEELDTEDLVITQLFEMQTEKKPNNIAAICNGNQLTYDELNYKSDQLAGVLRKNGVRGNNIIAIMIDRSLYMIIGIIGILKSAGAYMPIDPELPVERIMYMLEDSGASILITSNKYKYKIDVYKGIKIFLDGSDVFNEEIHHSKHVPSINDLAYLIYTSGSTGEPKGVMIEHKALTNFINGVRGIINQSRYKTILAITTISFDISILEILVPLTLGFKVVIADAIQLRDSEALVNLIIENSVDVLQTTPSRIKLLLENENFLSVLRKLNVLMIGGEASSVTLVNKLKNITNTKLFNMFGPTETTIWSTVKNLRDDDGVNIGKPIVNTRIYILDKDLNLLPIGVPGELCIAGEGLARGYFNKPELTAEKFVQLPLMNDEKIYRTGDLARWSSDGDIEFLGRIDNQIKIKGYRIELQEIETNLLKHEDIKEAIVVVKENTQGKYLCAYYISNLSIHSSDIKDYLLKKIPDYMVPSYFIKLDKMPLSHNGKIDRSLLPEFDIENNNDYQAPKDVVESKLKEILLEVMKNERLDIGVDRNFFDLGVHSLNSMTIISKIHKKFNVNITIRQLFNNPTIIELAKVIRKKVIDKYAPIKPTCKKEYYSLSSAQKRMFFIHVMNSGSVNYNLNLAVIIEGGVDKERLEYTLRKLMERHESLRTAFKVINDKPIQIIYNNVDLSIRYYESDKVQAKKVIDSFITPFDIQSAPLWRVGVIKIGENKSILVIDLHHIIVDGISCDILKHEFNILYKGGKLPELKLHYRDYVEWLNNSKNNKLISKQEKYWKRVFLDKTPVLNIKPDYDRLLSQDFQGGNVSFYIDEYESQKLRDLTKKYSATLFMLFLAIFNVLLSKVSGDEDISVGTVTAGRRHHDLNNIVGMFVNTLVLRNFPSKEKTFEEFFIELRERTLEAFENQEYPFEKLVDLLGVKRERGRNPLFEVMLVVQNFDKELEEIPDLKLRQYEYDQNISKFDLILGVIPGTKLCVNFEYNTRLYKESTINRFALCLRKIISSILKNHKVRLMDVDIYDSEEKNALINDLRCEKDNTLFNYIENNKSKDDLLRDVEFDF